MEDFSKNNQKFFLWGKKNEKTVDNNIREQTLNLF